MNYLRTSGVSISTRYKKQDPTKCRLRFALRRMC